MMYHVYIIIHLYTNFKAVSVSVMRHIHAPVVCARWKRCRQSPRSHCDSQRPWCLELGNLGNLGNLECCHDVTTCSSFQCLPAANLGKSLSLSLSPFEQESIVPWSWLCVTAIRIAVAEIVVQVQREFGTEIKMKLHNIHCNCNLNVLNNLWKILKATDPLWQTAWLKDPHIHNGIIGFVHVLGRCWGEWPICPANPSNIQQCTLIPRSGWMAPVLRWSCRVLKVDMFAGRATMGQTCQTILVWGWFDEPNS